MAEPRIIVVMGVSGCGKSTLGKALGRALHAPFIDADDLHGEANRARMSAGIPLTDEDRWPWLDAVGAALAEGATRKGIAVGACSALKRAYRDRLSAVAAWPVTFVHLTGPLDTLAQRLERRTGHFMPLSLLQSQLDTLEPPDASEGAIPISLGLTTDQQVAAVLRAVPGLKAFRRKQ